MKAERTYAYLDVLAKLRAPNGVTALEYGRALWPGRSKDPERDGQTASSAGRVLAKLRSLGHVDKIGDDPALARHFLTAMGEGYVRHFVRDHRAEDLGPPPEAQPYAPPLMLQPSPYASGQELAAANAEIERLRGELDQWRTAAFNCAAMLKDGVRAMVAWRRRAEDAEAALAQLREQRGVERIAEAVRARLAAARGPAAG